jgi:delta 1-pyrroline-5-carboxylate dehydrogenase
MTGNMPKASESRMRRHDDLVVGVPDDLVAMNAKFDQLAGIFREIHYHSERASDLAFKNAVAGVRGAHAGRIQADHFDQHLAAILKHAQNLADSTRGARHEMSMAEAKTQHDNIQEIRSQVDRARELAAGVHNDLDNLHSKLIQLEAMYKTD